MGDKGQQNILKRRRKNGGQPANMQQVNYFAIRQRLEKYQSSIVQEVDKRISGMIDDLMRDTREKDLLAMEFGNFAEVLQYTNNVWKNRALEQQAQLRNCTECPGITMLDGSCPVEADAGDAATTKRTQRKRTFPTKVFVERESFLTGLLKVEHMKTIYHIFYVIMVFFLMNNICYDYFVEGRLNFGFGTFESGLDKIHYVAGVWLLQHGFVFGLYYAVEVWGVVRLRLVQKPTALCVWSTCCLIGHIATQILFGYAASMLCLKFDLPFVSACVLLLETTRLLMKMHAFVRTVAARILEDKLKTENREKSKTSGTITMPPFDCYLFFLFAPTLIYRDTYPRTKQIRWRFAISRILEVVAIAFLYSHIYERHIRVQFEDFGLIKLTTSAIIVKLFGMFLPSMVIFLCGFYMILHSWLNFTSELLQFGDRMFYKDWWTSATYDAYYRNWNVVVHDWLYEYIYKDFYNHIFGGSKLAASLMVFLVSAIVHEHVLGFAMQLFFPVIFVLFGVVGVIFIFLIRMVPKDFGNIFIWFSLVLGNGLLVSLYSAEYYSKKNCKLNYNTWIDYITPAIWNCLRN